MFTEFYGVVANDSYSWDVPNNRIAQIVDAGGTIKSIDRQIVGQTLYVIIAYDAADGPKTAPLQESVPPMVW